MKNGWRGKSYQSWDHRTVWDVHRELLETGTCPGSRTKAGETLCRSIRGRNRCREGVSREKVSMNLFSY